MVFLNMITDSLVHGGDALHAGQFRVFPDSTC